MQKNNGVFFSEHSVYVCLSGCETFQLTSNSEAAETARLMASHLMQSRSGSLVPSKSPATMSVKMSLTQQFTAAGIYLLFIYYFYFIIFI